MSNKRSKADSHVLPNQLTVQMEVTSMSNDAFVDAYFARINYQGDTDVSAQTLHALHAAHTLNIPFENLDVFLGKPILLDQDSLYKKIIQNKRGGYCFEMNGLFSIVLKELGFKVTDLLARGTL